MSEGYRQLISTLLTLIIVLMAAFVVHSFFGCMLWAAVISMASMPLYQKWQQKKPNAHNFNALSFTIIIAISLFLPLFWLISDLVAETQYFIHVIRDVNLNGKPVPEIFAKLPLIGDEISQYWQKHFAHPGGLYRWLGSLNVSLSPLSQLAKTIGYNLFHRGVQLAFTLIALFFFYRDGHILTKQITLVGEKYLGQRWGHYASQLPNALRGAVNGSVVVGIGVGVVMGILYWALGFAAPVLAGFLTAFAAMIPFVVPIVFLVVAFMLVISGALIQALLVIIIGTIVMFLADHFIKPILIGGSTRLPFLMVLFGILGGVETFGVLGLFLGPIVMVLFMTLWRELLEI